MCLEPVFLVEQESSWARKEHILCPLRMLHCGNRGYRGIRHYMPFKNNFVRAQPNGGGWLTFFVVIVSFSLFPTTNLNGGRFKQNRSICYLGKIPLKALIHITITLNDWLMASNWLHWHWCDLPKQTMFNLHLRFAFGNREIRLFSLSHSQCFCCEWCPDLSLLQSSNTCQCILPCVCVSQR